MWGVSIPSRQYSMYVGDSRSTARQIPLPCFFYHKRTRTLSEAGGGGFIFPPRINPAHRTNWAIPVLPCGSHTSVDPVTADEGRCLECLNHTVVSVEVVRCQTVSSLTITVQHTLLIIHIKEHRTEYQELSERYYLDRMLSWLNGIVFSPSVFPSTSSEALAD